MAIKSQYINLLPVIQLKLLVSTLVNGNILIKLDNNKYSFVIFCRTLDILTRFRENILLGIRYWTLLRRDIFTKEIMSYHIHALLCVVV